MSHEYNCTAFLRSTSSDWGCIGFEDHTEPNENKIDNILIHAKKYGNKLNKQLQLN